MNNDIQIFKKQELGQVRIAGDKNNPLFCLRDVCDVLGIDNNRNVKASIIKEFGDGVHQIYPISDTIGRQQQATFITEPQLYFVLMRSDKPKAKPFRQWVVNDVLPSIRKTGKYETNIQAISKEEYSLRLEEIRQHKADTLMALANKYRDKCNGRYSQILDSYATKELVGEHILPLPERKEHYYTAEEVGQLLGISANKIGRIANKHNLKVNKYGEWFIDKAKHSNKEIESFRYNQAGIDKIKHILASTENK